MFTGLIQGMGVAEAVEPRGKETRFVFRPEFDIPDMRLGESIAVNGVCLTVESFEQGTRPAFSMYASAETLSKSSLGAVSRGSRVNLERALALGDRLGGHLVSGHVDCLATVESVAPAGESKMFRLRFPREFTSQVVEKGSVTLDGVSLTVNLCQDDWFTVNIIPATQKETTIGSWRPGSRVNLETDLIGKYVQKMLAARLGEKPSSTGGDISEAFLRKHGF